MPQIGLYTSWGILSIVYEIICSKNSGFMQSSNMEKIFRRILSPEIYWY